MKRYFLFDLDGTVSNTGEGVMKSVQYALDEFGYYNEPEESLRRFIGPPLQTAFTQFFNMTEEQMLKAVEKYRERYAVKGVYESPLYDGMKELLEELSAKLRTLDNAALCLATSKPLLYAEQIVEMRGIRPCFDIVMGAAMDGSLTEKPDIIREVIKQLGDPPREQIIMIGDRHHDVLGAAECGIECIGVEFGFAPPGELKESGAKYVVPTVEELKKLIFELI